MLQVNISSTRYANTGIKNNDDGETPVLQLLTSGYKILACSMLYCIFFFFSKSTEREQTLFPGGLGIHIHIQHTIISLERIRQAYRSLDE